MTCVVVDCCKGDEVLEAHGPIITTVMAKITKVLNTCPAESFTELETTHAPGRFL